MPESTDLLFVHVLEKIVSDPVLETEWVDLLSQLEYVGSRKIVKSVKFESVSPRILKHIAEEADHAWKLKALTVRRGLPPERSWAQGFFSQNGWDYFQKLDRAISASVEGVGCYPAVSWIVEKRVMQVYPAYLEMTRDDAIRDVLFGIISQERTHSAQFDSMVDVSLRGYATDVERKLWKEFLDGVWEKIERLTPQ